jgi:hypothetical protein
MNSVINPKLAALAAQLDTANARYRKLLATMEDSHERDDLTDVVLHKIYRLEDRLAAVRATNLDELKLKARYVDFDCMGADLPEAIMRDLQVLDGNRTENGTGQTNCSK